jgi:hypothetical protein
MDIYAFHNNISNNNDPPLSNNDNDNVILERNASIATLQRRLEENESKFTTVRPDWRSMMGQFTSGFESTLPYTLMDSFEYNVELEALKMKVNTYKRRIAAIIPNDPLSPELYYIRHALNQAKSSLYYHLQNIRPIDGIAFRGRCTELAQERVDLLEELRRLQCNVRGYDGGP